MNQLNIALIPLQRLGDGVISLVLANNLHLNKHSVTMFHSLMQPINDWFEFKISAYPDHDKLENILEGYDIVLMDMCIPYVLSKSRKEQEALSKKYIFYAVGRLQTAFTHDHTERLVTRLGKASLPLFEHIAKGCHTIKYDRKDSMVDNMTHYCQRTLQLKHVSNQTGIKIPDSFQFNKQNKRVVIAPTSSLEKKNWGAKSFVSLARLLKDNGFEPVFAVSISEWPEWIQIINNEFNLPRFDTVKLYAEYLYESACLIGNDSGGGHMASLMGAPVLTIVTSPKKLSYKWRPGWGSNAVVAPYFTFKFMGRRHWRPFLSVNKVFTEFKQLTGQ